MDQLTSQEAAAELGYTVQHVRRLAREGRLEAKKSGRDWLIDASSVLNVLASQANHQLPFRSRALTLRRAGETPPLHADLQVRETTASSSATVHEGVTLGQSWQLIEADCQDALPLLPDAVANCVVTSPPYYWQRDYGVSGQIGHEDTIEEYVESLLACFRGVWRVMREDGVFFLNIGDTYYSAKGRPHGRDRKSKGRDVARRKLRAVDGPGLGLPRKSLIGIPWRVALAMQADGWTLRSAVVWRKPAALPEPSARDRPWRTYEHVFLFSKSARYAFDRGALEGEEDMWRISAFPDNPGAHFAPFPLALAERCVLAGSPQGGVVLDPFVGSGTTAVAALTHGRQAIGIELSSEYCKFARKRLMELDDNTGNDRT